MARWAVDTNHSVAAFSVRHMMVANIHGQFNRMSGAIDFDPSDLRTAKVELEIEVGSMTTGIKKRDDHLFSADFFDAEKFPRITFRSTAVEPTGSNSANVSGELTIRGQTRPVTVKARCFGPVKSPFGETKMGFSAEATINREDFGMNWNTELEAGGLMLGREVELTLELEADPSD
jgi:polyisoprenoid-binding protein YceI